VSDGAPRFVQIDEFALRAKIDAMFNVIV